MARIRKQLNYYRIERNSQKSMSPASAWLPLFRRILHDHGITHIDNATMLKKIDQCGGSGRDVIESAKKIILRHDEGMPIDAFTATSAVV